jgi:hypothetical protein
MKFKLNSYLCLISGVILMANLFGCSAVKFEKYSSKDPMINISLDYISGWKFNETRGSFNSYAQVMFYPFAQGKKSPKIIMEVTVRDSSKMESAASTVEAAVQDLLAKRMKFKDAKVLLKSNKKVLDTQAVAIELSYLTLENLLKIDSRMITVKEEIVIFKKDNKFYFLRLTAPQEEFDKYKSAFARMVRTIKIKGNK